MRQQKKKRTMMEQQICHQKHIISKLISYAGSTLRITLPELKRRFKDYPLCQIDYIERDLQEYLVEIRFDNEQATLSCMFDHDLKCNGSFLFFDDSDGLDDCINYLKSMHIYDFISCRWQLPDCYLSLKKAERDACLFFYNK